MTYVGDSISVLCQCDANPAAKIEWSNTTPNSIDKRTEVSLELKIQFQSTGRHNFTCIARNTIGSTVNEVFIVVKEKATEPTNPISSTGKVISSSMLIGILCGCLAVVIIVIIAFSCAIVWKIRKETPTRERADSTHNQKRQPSFQPQDPDHNDPACSNPGYGPSEAIAESVEYTCVVKRAVRQAPKPQTEEGALIYADLDLPAEGSTRRKPTVISDAETTYVSIDFAKTKK
ncbi:sialic acid-binding Ig-like lectin 7 isoform X4 [Mya arenaria]|nr:sialic acid-binding Ig-like lectin 7 isoform X4 [Mya arenaria]